MQKITDQITDHLAGLITSEKPVYTPKELLKAKIPSFIVERIRLSLEDKVREEIGKNASIWFDGESKLVQDAWADYVQVAIGTSHIPKEELYTILSGVVSDIIKVFIEPRKNMADYVFREDDELSLPEIEERCARLTIYKHFGTAIPLYMKKRNLDILTRERCKQLIQNLDAKLVASYSPQDWAQKLEQLFVLFGGEVEPKLLAVFFEDKGLTAIAKRFGAKRKPITKSDFIFIISSKETDSRKSETLSDAEAQAKEEDKEQSLIESFFGDYQETDDSLVDQYVEGGLTDGDMAELLEE
ncbi:MAG: hypothetical protein MI700_02630, partial [Balneolales bacterium]|nr:hypothetical protein [Balneolales bacterium]